MTDSVSGDKLLNEDYVAITNLVMESIEITFEWVIHSAKTR